MASKQRVNRIDSELTSFDFLVTGALVYTVSVEGSGFSDTEISRDRNMKFQSRINTDQANSVLCK